MKHLRSEIYIGPSNTLISEEHFLDELKPLGVTRRGWRRFCRSLGVPCLEVGATRFYDRLTLQTGLRAALRLGQPDLLFPGSDTLKRGKPPKQCTTTLDQTYVQQNLEAILSEVLLHNRLRKSQALSDRNLKTAARKAAEALISSGWATLPPKLAQQLSDRSIREARDSQLFETSTERPSRPSTTSEEPRPPSKPKTSPSGSSSRSSSTPPEAPTPTRPSPGSD